MKRLLLVPHGQTPWNEAGRFQGHTDVGMNERGFEQARRMAEGLRHEKIAAIVASDLQRATQTAAPVSQLHGLPVRTDQRLRELRFGEWEGLTGPEIAVRDPAGWQRWDMGLAADFPGGETLTELAQRLRSFLDEVIAPHEEDGALLIVAHRGTLRVMVCVLLSLEPMCFRRFHLNQTSVTEVRIYPHETILHRFNDTHHLDGLCPPGRS